MLVLYETALGFCLFKLTDTAKLESADLWEEFESPEKANKLYVPANLFIACMRVLNPSLRLVLRNAKVEAPRSAPIHVYRDCRRRNHRDSGRKNWQGPEKVPVRRDPGERQGQAISLCRG